MTADGRSNVGQRSSPAVAAVADRLVRQDEFRVALAFDADPVGERERVGRDDGSRTIGGAPEGDPQSRRFRVGLPGQQVYRERHG